MNAIQDTRKAFQWYFAQCSAVSFPSDFSCLNKKLRRLQCMGKQIFISPLVTEHFKSVLHCTKRLQHVLFLEGCDTEVSHLQKATTGCTSHTKFFSVTKWFHRAVYSGCRLPQMNWGRFCPATLSLPRSMMHLHTEVSQSFKNWFSTNYLG